MSEQPGDILLRKEPDGRVVLVGEAPEYTRINQEFRDHADPKYTDWSDSEVCLTLDNIRVLYRIERFDALSLTYYCRKVGEVRH